MTAVAQSTMLRDDTRGRARLGRPGAGAGRGARPAARPAGRAGGEGLGADRPPADRRARAGDAGRAGRRGREAGRVGAGRPRAEQPGAGRAADLAGRARRDAGADAGRRRAGRLRVARRRGVLPGPGPAGRCARATCGAAIAALEQGRDRDRGYLRRGRRADYHAVFLAGLYLEAGELDGVEEIIDELRGAARASRAADRARPRLPPRLPARRPDGAPSGCSTRSSPRWPSRPWRSGSQAHDLISAALARRPAAATGSTAMAPASCSTTTSGTTTARWSTPSSPRRTGEHADGAGRLPGGRRVARSCRRRCAAPRASARPAACSRWTGADAAAEQVDAAAAPAGPLGRLAGGRSSTRCATSSGWRPADGARTVTGAAALTPREREVALLIADGLTNAELARRLYISPEDGRRARLQHPAQARRRLAHRGGGRSQRPLTGGQSADGQGRPVEGARSTALGQKR